MVLLLVSYLREKYWVLLSRLYSHFVGTYYFYYTTVVYCISSMCFDTKIKIIYNDTSRNWYRQLMLLSSILVTTQPYYKITIHAAILYGIRIINSRFFLQKSLSKFHVTRLIFMIFGVTAFCNTVACKLYKFLKYLISRKTKL